MKKAALLLLAVFVACSSDMDSDSNPQNPTPEALYFPPTTGSDWEATPTSELGWSDPAMSDLYAYLELKNTKSFMILVDGKIALEYYFGSHTASTPWYWASAGKTLTAAMTGIAQDEGILTLNDKVSDHLGTGWTSLTTQQENQITNFHLLTMTSGIDDVNNDDCVSPDCLNYLAPAGTRWAYDNVYVKLQDVVAQASGQTWPDYFNTKLKNRIGMTGSWVQTGNLSVYWSNTRSMARFGLLMLAEGNWDGTQIISKSFCENATKTSQQINKGYGYLWWINGESSYHLPQSQLEFNGSLIPDAPSDMYAALGLNDQKIYVIPSKKMVIVRMGDSADGTNFALSDFDDVLWQKINAVID